MSVRWILINENDEPVDPENHLEEALSEAKCLVEVMEEELKRRLSGTWEAMEEILKEEHAAMTNKVAEDCFGRNFIVRRQADIDHEWEVLTQDLEMPSLGFVILLDTVDDCDTEEQAIATWQIRCQHNLDAGNAPEDSSSPFFGLTDETKDQLLQALQNHQSTPSNIKGRDLPSRDKK